MMTDMYQANIWCVKYSW